MQVVEIHAVIAMCRQASSSSGPVNSIRYHGSNNEYGVTSNKLLDTNEIGHGRLDYRPARPHSDTQR